MDYTDLYTDSDFGLDASHEYQLFAGEELSLQFHEEGQSCPSLNVVPSKVSNDSVAVNETVKRPVPKKLHSHHGTNASSDAAGMTRRYHCLYPGCGKEFSTSGHLCRHNRTHTGEKNFACRECGARFSRQDNCNQHAKSHASLKRTPSRPTKLSNGLKAIAPSRSSSSPTIPIGKVNDIDQTLASRTTSYAGSLVTSDTGYASSSNEYLNESEFSPILNSQGYEFGQAIHFPELPQSLFDQILEQIPPLVCDSSTAETDGSYQSFLNNDYISEEDFFNWSDGVPLTGEQTHDLDIANYCETSIGTPITTRNLGLVRATQGTLIFQTQ